ncbi:hypothetical protein QTO05_15735, partial [Vibrio fortis]|uniref:hypothetical protein n=1 Tax=Vibrio fortis TaxID=212667 RepID=UPI002F3FCF0A
MTDSYNESNQNDSDEYTKVINAALYKIESNPGLKPTIAQIVKMTGLHRNTISNRGWPSAKLKEIKAERHQTKLRAQNGTKSQKAPKELLSLALDEVLY